MREQQRSAQISFILCQLWIGAEEANSLESYKKKVSEIIKQPATGLSAHSQPDWGTVETSCQVSVWPSEHRHFNSLGSYKKNNFFYSCTWLPVFVCVVAFKRIFNGSPVNYLTFSGPETWHHHHHHHCVYCSLTSVTHGHCQGAHVSLRNLFFFSFLLNYFFPFSIYFSIFWGWSSLLGIDIVL